MQEVLDQILDYYNEEVVKLMVDKYDFTETEALCKYKASEIYKMFIDPELEMWDFSPRAIVEMWECEQETGDPRNSIYIRRDEICLELRNNKSLGTA